MDMNMNMNMDMHMDMSMDMSMGMSMDMSMDVNMDMSMDMNMDMSMGMKDNQPPTEQFDARRRFDEEGKLVLELGDTVGQMKRKFGVDKVLVWHAMAGYWAGVEPEAEEMAGFEPRVTKLLAPKGIREADPKVRRAPCTMYNSFAGCLLCFGIAPFTALVSLYL